MDPERVDRLLVYAVACAAHHEPPRDELTREHLYKLVYLADLEHARGAGRGAGYTGARWVFGRRGPRCPALADRLDDALARAGAELRPPEPGLRRADAFALAGRELRDRLDAALPLPVSRAIRAATREFAGERELAALLTRVYRTGPMLHAAPGEPLELARARPRPRRRAPGGDDDDGEALTPRQQKRRRERLRELKAELSAQRRQRGPGRDGRARQHLPAYSSAVLAALEQHARPGRAAPEGPLTLRVDPDVWRDHARSEHDVP